MHSFCDSSFYICCSAIFASHSVYIKTKEQTKDMYCAYFPFSQATIAQPNLRSRQHTLLRAHLYRRPHALNDIEHTTEVQLKMDQRGHGRGQIVQEYGHVRTCETERRGHASVEGSREKRRGTSHMPRDRSHEGTLIPSRRCGVQRCQWHRHEASCSPARSLRTCQSLRLASREGRPRPGGNGQNAKVTHILANDSVGSSGPLDG